MDCITCKGGMHHLTKDLFICDDCGLVSSNIFPDPSIYDRSYEIKYSRYESTKIGEKIQEFRYQIVKRHIKSGKVLDFGCGVGSFLKRFIEPEIQAVGFDINPYVEFCDIATLFDKYDAVTFWDSLEHLKDPASIIKGLNPEYVFVCTPSLDDHKGEITDWRHYMPVEHCHYFHRYSLTAFLEHCGYELLGVNYGESRFRNGGGDKNILTMAAKRMD